MSFLCRKSSNVIGKSWDFYEIVDKLTNKNGFRYSYAISDPNFTNIKYRQTDVAPYHARFSFEDSPAAIAFSKDGLAVTTSDAWHSARANVCAREGAYYYEAKVISGIVNNSESSVVDGNNNNSSSIPSRGHVRLGFARREAELDVNVGVDCYGYGIRDVNGEVINRMRCEHFFDKGENIAEGDVIGLLIQLPPLSVHKQVVEGTYDPSREKSSSSTSPPPVNFIRDRVPFHLKSDFCWQQSNIYPSKQLRDYAFNLKETPTFGPPSPFNSEDPSLRTLPGSSITIFKNGIKMGTPFKELFAFLPPASRLTNGTNNLGIGERENADDGMIGYFPTVSCYSGGAVECRFEPPWWFGPPPTVGQDGIKDDKDEEQQTKPVVAKPFGERFNDQIVEDVVADIVDEIEAMLLWGNERSSINITSGVGGDAGGINAKNIGKNSRSIPGTPNTNHATGPTVVSTEIVKDPSTISNIEPASGQQGLDVVQDGVGAVYQAAMSNTNAPPTIKIVEVGQNGSISRSEPVGDEDHYMSGLDPGTENGQSGNKIDEDTEMT